MSGGTPTRTISRRLRREVRVEVPNQAGQSDEDIKQLIDTWIVPQLIRTFLLDANAKKPVQSITVQSLTELDAPPGQKRA